MLNALTYLTRRCPRKCNYCALRDTKPVKAELSVGRWKQALQILKDIGVEFNLILGNETWVMGSDLVEIMKSNQVPYALYTTCPPYLFRTYRQALIGDGVVDNLSCGIDWPKSFLMNATYPLNEDSFRKSWDAWDGFQWLKSHYPTVDSQGTVTVHRQNYRYLPALVRELGDIGVFCGVNFIHWDQDGSYDFFPSGQELGGQRLLFMPEDRPKLRKILDEILGNPALLQNPEMLKEDVNTLIDMRWHCKGNPYGGPTVDSDGTLRCCGYRPGKRCPQFTIFDLTDETKKGHWRNAMYQDAMECPGCTWSYPWMYHYWLETSPAMGAKVFRQHAGNHIQEEKWSKRKI